MSYYLAKPGDSSHWIELVDVWNETVKYEPIKSFNDEIHKKNIANAELTEMVYEGLKKIAIKVKTLSPIERARLDEMTDRAVSEVEKAEATVQWFKSGLEKIKFTGQSDDEPDEEFKVKTKSDAESVTLHPSSWLILLAVKSWQAVRPEDRKVFFM